MDNRPPEARIGVSGPLVARLEPGQAYAAADAAVASARAMLDVVDVDVKKSQLTAPFDAEVLQRMADEGRVLAAGTPVLTLMDNRPPEARIGVSGPLVAQLEPGQTYELHVEGQPHPARLTAVLRDRSTQTRTVDAVFQLQGHPPGWSAGDLVTLTQARELDQPNHRLPKTALTRGVRGLWACLVAVPDGDGGHVLERRELELLHQADGWVYVIGTLIDGERVVTGGLHKLAPGMSVRLSGSADGLVPAAPGDPS
jgi:RND family efflux transporter MFP subunit